MDLSRAHWRKSSFSGNNGGDCVEVAAVEGHEAPVANKANDDVVFAVRDSKNPERPALVFTRSEWDAFVAGVHAGEFDAETLLAAMNDRVLIG